MKIFLSICLIVNLLFSGSIGVSRTLEIPGMVVDVSGGLAATTAGKIYDISSTPREVLDVRNEIDFPRAPGLTAIATSPEIFGIWTFGIKGSEARVLRWVNGSPETILTITGVLTNSHGTDFLLFDEDVLFVGFGDSADFYLPTPNHEEVQSLSSYRGKILRIDPITGLGLSSNPFCEGVPLDSVQCRIYALGFRNPWSAAMMSDDLFIGDVGDHAIQEIDRIVPGGNYGWPCWEGDQISEFASLPICSSVPLDSTILPEYSYSHTADRSGVMGVAEVEDQFLIGDWRGEIFDSQGNHVKTFPGIIRLVSGDDSAVVLSFDRSGQRSIVSYLDWGYYSFFPGLRID